MVRICIAGWVIFLAVAALSLSSAAHAAALSPAPDGAASDCGWSEDGESWEDADGTVYTCHCARLSGPHGYQVICRWYAEHALPARKIHRAKKHAPLKRVVIRVGVQHA